MPMERRNFLYGGLRIPFVVEAKVDADRITVRTWRLSADANLADQGPDPAMIAAVCQHADPFVIDEDPFGFRKAGRDIWFPVAVLGGHHKAGDRVTNLYVKPVSQTGFVIDPLLLGSGAWSDYAVWSFNMNQNGRLEIPFNRHLLTRESRAHARLANLLQPSPILLVYTPFADADFSRCSFVLQYNDALGCVHNFDAAHQVPPAAADWHTLTFEQQLGVKGLLPALKLAGPDVIAAGEAAAFTVSLHDPDSAALIPDCASRLYLESDGGYLPKRQLVAASGAASFNLSALGLSPGEQIKLKAGWRNYPGAAEKIIAVV